MPKVTTPVLIALILPFGLLACASNEAESRAPGTESADAQAADDVATDCGEQSVVRFSTEDEVELVGDFLPTHAPEAGAVVLFHMIPPSNNRAGYPQRVLEALNGLGLSVLNVDRRGTGESDVERSGGVATEAYEGEGGRLDVEAAMRFLASVESCPVDLERVMLVGASNGTTAVLDYTVAHAEGLPDPVAMAWLSPGSYTENQHAVPEHRALLDELPLLFVFPDSEPWSLQWQDGAPDPWRFIQIEGGAHGTQNFDEGANETLQKAELLGWAEQFAAQ